MDKTYTYQEKKTFSIMLKISSLHAREILDSRGNPTVEVDLQLDNKFFGRAAVPSGASVGTKEAIELRDGGTRYKGKGVLNAVGNINGEISKTILNKIFETQKDFDHTLINLDGTENKSRLGANAILACSIAYAKAMASAKNQQLFSYIGNGNKLPVAMMNVINGGAHADNPIDIQEFMIIPHAFEFNEGLRVGAEIFHTLKSILKDKKLAVNVGDEGGFAPDIKSSKAALDILLLAIQKAGYKAGEEVSFALDCAASEFYAEGKYNMVGEGLVMNSEQLVNYYETLCNDYPIISIEDPMSEHDWNGWKLITESLGKKIQIVGDDVFVTNKKILQEGIDKGIANAILIKLNQIGTLTETIETMELAKKNGYKSIVSHRSGETEDTTISHLAVGTGCGQIKTGSLCRTDRVCKYNELLRISELLH